MRLFLLPVSTRRTLLYAHHLNAASAQQETWMERTQQKASKLWASWEDKESGWQKTVVNYGNHALRRIPYEEWGLKSVPPLSARRREDTLKGETKAEVVYPKTLIPMDKVTSVLNALSTEREGLHRRKLIYCLIGMPVVAPFALVPVIPNIPFFYLAYRAWSHWRALNGGKHIQFLLENKLFTYTPSPILDEVYSKQKSPLPSTPEPTTDPGGPKNLHPKLPEEKQPDGEMMLLSQANGKKMCQALDLPQLEVELERAIWQVETAIKKQNAERHKDESGIASGAKASDDEKKVQ